HSADATPRPSRMNEERANLRRVALRIQQLILAAGPMIAAVERLALAPAAAANDDALRAWTRLGLGNNIGTVGNELAVHAQNRFQRAFDLRRSVVLRLQAADGSFNQFLQGRHILQHGEA